MSLVRIVSGSVTRSATQLHANRFNPRLHDANLTLLYQFDKYKSLAATDGLGPVIGITRTTDATYFDSSGILQTAASGIPRFDHNPSTGESLGLLVETARTNICLQSEDFTTTWVNNNTDEPTTNNTAPNNTATADEIAATSTADIVFSIFQSFTGRTAAETTTISCYLKAGTNATFAQLVYDADGGGTDGFFCNFRLDDGTKGTVTAFAAGTATSSTIEDIGNGWHRCSITGKIAAGTVARLTIVITDIITAAGFEAANLADNDSIIMWGADIEIGAFPTSYIKTAGSSVTRNADVVSTTDVSWYNSNATTLYVDASVPFIGKAPDKFLITISSQATSNRITIFRQASGGGDASRIRVLTAATSGNTGSVQVDSQWADGQSSKSAIGFALDDLVYYFDGAQLGTDSTADVPIGVSRLNIGSGHDGGNQFNGHIAEIRYYNVRKNNQFLEDLSNGIITA